MHSSSWRKIHLKLDCPEGCLGSLGVHLTAVGFLAQVLFGYQEIITLPVEGVFLMDREDGVIFHEKEVADWPVEVLGEEPLTSVISLEDNLEAVLFLEKSYRSKDFGNLIENDEQVIRVNTEDFGSPRGDLKFTTIRRSWFSRPVVNWRIDQGTGRPGIFRPRFV